MYGHIPCLLHHVVCRWCALVTLIIWHVRYPQIGLKQSAKFDTKYSIVTGCIHRCTFDNGRWPDVTNVALRIMYIPDLISYCHNNPKIKYSVVNNPTCRYHLPSKTFPEHNLAYEYCKETENLKGSAVVVMRMELGRVGTVWYRAQWTT